MNTIAWDIETAPLPNAMALIHQHYPFNPDSVKMGNLKDPDKRQAKLEEARSSHAFKLKEKAQLDPLLSYVCAIGIMYEPGHMEWAKCFDHKLEPKLLEWFAEQVRSRWTGPLVQWVGWNIHEFDLPYYFKRCWLTGTLTPSGLRQGRYWNKHWIDLMKEWTMYGWQEYAKLEAVAEMLGVTDPDRPEGARGKDFYKVLAEDEDRARAYLRADLSEALAIAEAIL